MEHMNMNVDPILHRNMKLHHAFVVAPEQALNMTHLLPGRTTTMTFDADMLPGVCRRGKIPRRKNLQPCALKHNPEQAEFVSCLRWHSRIKNTSIFKLLRQNVSHFFFLHWQGG